jgi:hypothetical protein
MIEKELLEKLAELEHQQWMAWAKKVLERENISPETRSRWESCFVPYADLPDDIQEFDREYARKAIDILNNK